MPRARAFVAPPDQGNRSRARMTPQGRWAMCGFGASCTKRAKAIHYDIYEMTRRKSTTSHRSSNVC
jgi:hypothetical protein